MPRGEYRRVKRFTNPQIIKALKASVGKIYAAAKKLGCSASLIYQRAKKSKPIRIAIHEAREWTTDLAEDVILHHLKRKNLEAAKFHLKTKGKKRGYVEEQRHQVTGKEGQPLLSLEAIVAAVVRAEETQGVVNGEEIDAGTGDGVEAPGDGSETLPG